MSNPPASGRRTQRLRFEIQHRELQIARIEALSPGFVAITLQGDSLADFQSPSFDDHIKFFCPDGQGGETGRDYTPRRVDNSRRELRLEFALHGEGPAADWARQAQVGQFAHIAGPRGSTVIPLDYDWHLLAGDSSALPAIHRRLEELPAGTHAIVLLQIDPADRRALHSKAELELHWVDDSAQWLQALRSLPLPAGEGYVWCAGEASVMNAARQVMLEERGHPLEHLKVAAYWKPESPGFHEH